MAEYIVFSCPKCGLVRYARIDQRTAKCLRCNHQIRIDLQKIKVLARVKDVRDAVDIVKAYKARLKS